MTLAGQQRELDLRQQLEVVETEIVLGVDQGAGLRRRLVDAQVGGGARAEQIHLDAQAIFDHVRTRLRRPVRQRFRGRCVLSRASERGH